MLDDVYLPMSRILPEGSLGTANIVHWTPTIGALLRSTVQDFSDEQLESDYTYVQLRCGTELVMSDTPMERATNFEAVARAHGDVLVTGLGLGLVVAPMLCNPDVETVTVVEKRLEVIELVGSKLRRFLDPVWHKLVLVCADAFIYWTPKTYDVIYHDIWSSIKKENLEEIEQLKARYALTNTHRSWQGAWVEDRLTKT